jgi:23S rRNA pseudouridine1911/1915/1917 synthase
VPRRPEARTFAVAGDVAGLRLDVAVARHADVSRAVAGRLVAGGSVTVDGAPARKGHVLRAGETVAYTLPPDEPAGVESEDVPLRVVYEDDWLLVVDKPAGVVVHPAPGHEHGTLVHGLVARGIRGGHGLRPGVVHRIDKETSGLLIVARRDDAYRRLVATMAQREISRIYVALLAGSLPQDEGTVDAPIGRHVRDRKRMSVHTAHPRPAVTHFRALARAAGYTLAEIRLETGRTHQIRVHMAALGYPVAGDATYGGRPRPEGLTRHFLHAARLSFPHPEDGRRMTFDAPLPPELCAFLVARGLPLPTLDSPGGGR